MNDVSIPPLWEKINPYSLPPSLWCEAQAWQESWFSLLWIASSLNKLYVIETEESVFHWDLKVICIEPWEFPSYQILKLSLLKQERDPRAWRFWVSGLDPLIMGAKGRSATSFSIWTAMFIEVGTEMLVASPLALAVWAERSCVAAYPLITLMVDSSLEYQKFVATGFWPYREKGEEMGLQATYKVMSH